MSLEFGAKIKPELNGDVRVETNGSSYILADGETWNPAEGVEVTGNPDGGSVKIMPDEIGSLSSVMVNDGLGFADPVMRVYFDQDTPAAINIRLRPLKPTFRKGLDFLREVGMGGKNVSAYTDRGAQFTIKSKEVPHGAEVPAELIFRLFPFSKERQKLTI